MQSFIRTSTFRILCLLTLILVGLLALPHSAFASSTVSKGFECKLLARDSGLPVTVVTTNTHSVISSSGNSTLTCHFTYKGTGLPTSALQIRKFTCGTYAGITTDSKVVISPSGKITMTCHVKANKGGGKTPSAPGGGGGGSGEISGVVF
jgi:hypothetical protein